VLKRRNVCHRTEATVPNEIIETRTESTSTKATKILNFVVKPYAGRACRRLTRTGAKSINRTNTITELEYSGVVVEVFVAVCT
jgi:hypothetical protein